MPSSRHPNWVAVYGGNSALLRCRTTLTDGRAKTTHAGRLIRAAQRDCSTAGTNASHQDLLRKGDTATFSRKIILLAAVALAISLGTACSSFDATPAVNHQTAEPTATSKATNSTLPPENGAANNAVATQPHPENQTLQDNQRWYLAWALDNLKPHVYAEFAKLDPAKWMTSTERYGEKG